MNKQHRWLRKMRPEIQKKRGCEVEKWQEAETRRKYLPDAKHFAQAIPEVHHNASR